MTTSQEALITNQTTPSPSSLFEEGKTKGKLFTLKPITIMTKKETAKFIVQLIASIASAILTALGATSCMGY